MTTNLWVDRYVSEVGRLVPSAKRGDIELEIRSLLHDELDALPESATSTPAACEAATLDVLRKFGDPAAIAARYGAQRYLIGPTLYPVFLMVLRVVLALVLSFSVVAVAMDLRQGSSNLSLLGTPLQILNALIQATAWVVVVFALSERLKGNMPATNGQVWDPKSLPDAADRDRIDWSDMVTDITTSLVGIIFFNVYVQGAPVVLTNGTWWLAPVFSDTFVAYIPWLTALWALTLALAIAVIARGRWETLTHVLRIALGIAGLAIFASMLAAGSLAAFPPAEPIFTITIVIIMILTAYETFQSAWTLFGRRSHTLAATAGSQSGARG